ncbi:MAG: 2-phospho-L-lactate transferase [Chloroflexi bacterium]|nr:2-phospho-L-lactate transferase [Chloroflexota bacterium]
MRVTLLAGGTGGTKLAHGFALLDAPVELTVVANVGDDFELHGLHVSPDIDALLYTLGGLIDVERGWGIRGDTLSAHAMLERYGEPGWFTVGDADLATHVERSRRLREGHTLTDATAAMATALGIGVRILPSTDDRYRTQLDTDEGRLEFQEYFVRRHQEPEVRAIVFEGAETARPSAAVLEAIASADLIVIGPSNPFVSIGPILHVRGVRAALEASPAGRIAVSPIVAGRALKGPADRMLASLGHEPSALGVARMYAGLVGRFVLDEADASLASEVEALGMTASAMPTVMRGDGDRRALAARIVQELSAPSRDRRDR